MVSSSRAWGYSATSTLLPVDLTRGFASSSSHGAATTLLNYCMVWLSSNNRCQALAAHHPTLVLSRILSQVRYMSSPLSQDFYITAAPSMGVQIQTFRFHTRNTLLGTLVGKESLWTDVPCCCLQCCMQWVPLLQHSVWTMPRIGTLPPLANFLL